MESFAVAGKLATYTVTPTSPITAEVQCLTPFKVNRSTVVVNRFEGLYVPEDAESTRHRGPWFHETSYGYRTIFEPDPANPSWGTDVTDNAKQKVRDDIEACALPLFARADFIEAGMRNAFERAQNEMRKRAERDREKAAELLQAAEAADQLAIAFEVHGDAVRAYGLDGKTPAQIVARYRTTFHDTHHRDCYESRFHKLTKSPLRDTHYVHAAMAIEQAVQ